ncbi:MAG: hypothetical protein AAF721_32045 [Myxococcota bacterium]
MTATTASIPCPACGVETPSTDFLMTEQGEVCLECFGPLNESAPSLPPQIGTGVVALALGHFVEFYIAWREASYAIRLDFVGIIGGLVAAGCGVGLVRTGLRHRATWKSATISGGALLLLGLALAFHSAEFAWFG